MKNSIWRKSWWWYPWYLKTLHCTIYSLRRNRSGTGCSARTRYDGPQACVCVVFIAVLVFSAYRPALRDIMLIWTFRAKTHASVSQSCSYPCVSVAFSTSESVQCYQGHSSSAGWDSVLQSAGVWKLIWFSEALWRELISDFINFNSFLENTAGLLFVG